MLDVQRIVVGSLQANCYVVSVPDGDAVVIDPGDQFELIDAAIAGADGVAEVHAVLCTHAHDDHLGAAVPVGEKYEAPFHLHEADARLLQRANLFRALVLDEEPVPVPRIEVSIADSEVLRFGALEVRVVHTPGHSPGSVCFGLGDALFTGDTVESGRIGRTDIPGGDRASIEASLSRIVDRFGPETVLYPGHGEPAPLGTVLPGAIPVQT